MTYLDTSALAKWYLNEPGSEAFSDWIRTQDDVRISTLTALELRSLLARRRRMRELTVELEQQAFATFINDVEQGHLIQYAVQDEQVVAAVTLLEQLAPIPLRTLDALHLSIAQKIGAECLATADRVMAKAGAQLGLRVSQPC